MRKKRSASDDHDFLSPMNASDPKPRLITRLQVRRRIVDTVVLRFDRRMWFVVVVGVFTVGGGRVVRDRVHDASRSTPHCHQDAGDTRDPKHQKCRKHVEEHADHVVALPLKGRVPAFGFHLFGKKL